MVCEPMAVASVCSLITSATLFVGALVMMFYNNVIMTLCAIGTLVERTTRFTILLHLPHGHDAEHVQRTIIDKWPRCPNSRAIR